MQILEIRQLHQTEDGSWIVKCPSVGYWDSYTDEEGNSVLKHQPRCDECCRLPRPEVPFASFLARNETGFYVWLCSLHVEDIKAQRLAELGKELAKKVQDSGFAPKEVLAAIQDALDAR